MHEFVKHGRQLRSHKTGPGRGAPVDTFYDSDCSPARGPFGAGPGNESLITGVNHCFKKRPSPDSMAEKAALYIARLLPGEKSIAVGRSGFLHGGDVILEDLDHLGVGIALGGDLIPGTSLPRLPPEPIHCPEWRVSSSFPPLVR